LSTTVTVLPPRPAFSIRSWATIFAGTGSPTLALQRQSAAGQPQRGQNLPLSVE
jgi:hypothetical protein